jgi:FtsP/CotA-like multicopper oxidase with cupredoxin domain
MALMMVALSAGGLGFADTGHADAGTVGQVREFKLTVGTIPWNLAPGRVFQAYAFNGQIPGPELRVTEGDLVSVEVVNNLDEETTIHWHGVDVTSSMDGAPQTSLPAIPPGGTFRYEFVATPAGTRWYHSHVNELHQQGGGLAGALIIEPRQPEAQPDREYTVLTQAWSTTDLGGVTGNDPMAPHHNAGASDLAFDGQRPAALHTVNGKLYPDGAPLAVEEGDRVRLRLINATTTDTQTFSLAGHMLTVTHSDGNPLARPFETESVMLGVGERADVEFTAGQPGRWQLRGFIHGLPSPGPAVDVVYAGHEDDAVQAPSALGPTATYADMATPGAPVAADQTYDMMFTQGAVGTSDWTINEQTYPDTAPVDVRPGQRIALRMVNMSTQDHPMHLHGHSFRVTAIGDKPVDGPLKDTLTMQHMEAYTVEFTANNPGRWLFHCHNLDHMMGGLMTEIRYP